MRLLTVVLAVMALPVWAQDIEDVLTDYGVLSFDRAVTGHQVVEMALNGQTGRFIIDSGAGQTVIALERADQFGLSEVTRIDESTVTGFQGAIGVAAHRIAGYQIGPVQDTDVIVFVADLGYITSAIESFGGPEIDGILGQDILTRHGAVLDLADDRLFLRP